MAACPRGEGRWVNPLHPLLQDPGSNPAPVLGDPSPSRPTPALWLNKGPQGGLREEQGKGSQRHFWKDKSPPFPLRTKGKGKEQQEVSQGLGSGLCPLTPF